MVSHLGKWLELAGIASNGDISSIAEEDGPEHCSTLAKKTEGAEETLSYGTASSHESREEVSTTPPGRKADRNDFELADAVQSSCTSGADQNPGQESTMPENPNPDLKAAQAPNRDSAKSSGGSRNGRCVHGHAITGVISALVR